MLLSPKPFYTKEVERLGFVLYRFPGYLSLSAARCTTVPKVCAAYAHYYFIQVAHLSYNAWGRVD